MSQGQRGRCKGKKSMYTYSFDEAQVVLSSMPTKLQPARKLANLLVRGLSTSQIGQSWSFSGCPPISRCQSSSFCFACCSRLAAQYALWSGGLASMMVLSPVYLICPLGSSITACDLGYLSNLCLARTIESRVQDSWGSTVGQSSPMRWRTSSRLSLCDGKARS